MATKATKDQKEEVVTLSQIDSLITILGDYPEATLPLTMDVNPFGFLLKVCKSLGIFDELMWFLAKCIQYELPLIELAVKGILLANIKELVSCSSDPFIPKYLRKQISSTDTTSGITFNISDIDFNNLMQINPLSEGSEYSYLGIDREYIATFQIMPKTDKKTIVNKISSWYKDKSKALDKLKKWENKYDTKYGVKVTSQGEDGTDIYQCTKPDEYNIPTREIQETTRNEERKTRGKKTKKTSYQLYRAVYQVEEYLEKPDNNGYYVNETKTFERYVKADSFLTTRRNYVYRKYYDLNKHKIKDEYREIAKIETHTITTPYELARAKDFNAFLWFVCHMANFNDPISLPMIPKASYPDVWEEWDSSNKYLDDYLKEHFNLTYIAPDTTKKVKNHEGPFGVIEAKEVLDAEGKVDKTFSPSGILGSVFRVEDGENSSLYDLCIKVDYKLSEDALIPVAEKDDYTYKKYTIVPATSDKKSLNWYGDRGKYFDFLKYYASPKKEKSESPRHYSKEIGICNIEFDTSINDTSQNTYFDRNKIRFTVLPKPLVHIPQWLTGAEWPWRFKMVLFDAYGRYSPTGKYSCFVTRNSTTQEPICYQQTDDSIKKDYPCYYELANQGGEGRGLFLHIPKHWRESVINDSGEKTKKSNLVVSKSSSSVADDDRLLDSRVPPSSLYECYPNLTIYEFNYDYIMSQRLFDPLVLAGELIESILNCKLGISGNLHVGVTHNIIQGNDRITESFIRDIITSDTYSSNDCYFKFSNKQYDEMARKTELKKAQGYTFGGSDRVMNVDTEKINSILQEYNNPDATPAGQVDVLNRAFNQMAASITAETEDDETWSLKFNIIQQLIEDLTFEIVKCILSPKIMMVLLVNKQLMGDDTEWTGDFLQNIELILMNIIIQIVKEIKDMLLSELLNFVMGYLKPKFEELAALIMKEYTEQYRDQIAALIKECGFGWGKQATADTKLDEVSYADIDPVEEVTKDNQC